MMTRHVTINPDCHVTPRPQQDDKVSNVLQLWPLTKHQASGVDPASGEAGTGHKPV